MILTNEQIDVSLAALGKAIREDNEAAGMKEIFEISAHALKSLGSIADSLQVLAIHAANPPKLAEARMGEMAVQVAFDPTSRLYGSRD